jgi:hypothetical protein
MNLNSKRTFVEKYEFVIGIIIFLIGKRSILGDQAIIVNLIN